MNQKYKILYAEIDQCMIKDQHVLRRRLKKTIELDDQSALQKIQEAITRSLRICEIRRQGVPEITYPEALPVCEKREEIAQTITNNQVVIICGETGSGKTTQLPKICLEIGRGINGKIAHTQPRRVAARSVAARIAEELGSNLGDCVGYKIRFSDHTQDSSYVKLMTDGILLAETQGDRFLNQYDTIIIDEAHERSLNIDFLLGYLQQLLPKRRDLKVIITSATIDPQRFSRHFSNAPVIEVSGRTFPVDILYRPQLEPEEGAQTRDLQQTILDAVDELSALSMGDILVFLSGEREIREIAEALRKHHPPHTEILPLYARLSAAEQNKVFRSHVGRRIVLATNVAETSLTIPGIKYVIDPGTARISRYSYRSKLQRLPIERISQASANQRSGRCGRISAGVCIRLYSEDDYINRDEFTLPEIQRTSLAAVILQMKSLGFGDIDQFPFVDRPDSRMIKDGQQTLYELGAMNESGTLTKTGQQLAKLPIDPRIGRMILAANEECCLTEVLIIAAVLSTQDPRERPLDAQQKADAKHACYKDERSDFLSFLKLWATYHDNKKHLSANKLKKFCKSEFISYMRMRDWRDVHMQLTTQATQMGLKLNDKPADYTNIHRALLTGLLSHIGFKQEGREFLGARNKKFQIFPGSALFKKSPKWLMAGEIVETAKIYARVVAKIEPEWLEQAAAHLIKHNYSEPHWEKKQAMVIGYERLSLYGIIVVAKRKVDFSTVDAKLAREIFIRCALIEGELQSKASFFDHNQTLISEIKDLEHRSRRQDILVDEEVLYSFYDQHLPPTVCDRRSLEKWFKRASSTQQQALLLKKEHLLAKDESGVSAENYPPHIVFNGLKMTLQYHFEPGHELDGVTVEVPLGLLNQLSAAPFEWLVPGLLKDKIVALIKTLPKRLRKNFIPAPQFADACMEKIQQQGSLLTALSQALLKMTGVEVQHSDWQSEMISNHLFINYRVINQSGKQVAMGRDLSVLQNQQGQAAAQSFAAADVEGYPKKNITNWDFGVLSEQIEIDKKGIRVIGYPGLLDEQNSVTLKLFDTLEKSQQETLSGLRRLFILNLTERVRYIEKNMPDLQRSCLLFSNVGTCQQLKQDLVHATIDAVCIISGEFVRDKKSFDARIEQAKKEIVVRANELAIKVYAILTEYHAVNTRLGSMKKPAWKNAVTDIHRQLNALIYTGFVSATPMEQLPHIRRYIKAIDKRLDKLKLGVAQDERIMAQFLPLLLRYEKTLENNNQPLSAHSERQRYRWMLEELKVSLFAQELKTAMPVSVKRLDKQWVKIRVQEQIK
ncbi:ATP-dependent helicase HrpA [hydrothermal vent metagenome]|uniref:RNA helicase n=1 Tax=hydrothermal vent metagenome TaxID=652676 RepID=A0A3B0Z288_9ZZZZ